ncbi:ribonuclease Z, mitochondrial isoform X2 [Apis laboriosa]|uniref:ribonuclease Z, mitochondrial isoform X2 n=1 Tax=Apis laboriosa TaxID=183418 RepID=UPI001CC567E6|nr:ribonuclease Z, mitochondrial isoform X2 [Apis laboriosa]
MFKNIVYCFKCIIRNIHKIELYKKIETIHETNNLSMQTMKRVKSYTHFNAKLKVLGSGALGTPENIFFISDHVNYIFNCGEGTQRLSQEHHCKLSKVYNIFVTHSSWKNVGGIPGFLLTAQSNGLKKINIHCPEGFDSFIQTIQSFISLPNLKISFPAINESKVYTDDIMNISYIPITKSFKSTEGSSLYLTDKEQWHTNINGKRVINKKTQEEEIKTEKKVKSIPHLLCFICEVHPKLGKLLINKCIDFGVSPGPDLNLLKQGVDITKEDGTIVYSKDVVEPSESKTIFIVLECPTEEYLDSIINHSSFLKYQTESTKKENEVFCIFHFTPEKIFTSQKYQDWIKKFSSKTEHIILNDENTCMGSEAVYKNQSLLNMLHPEIFPLLNKDCFEKDKETMNNNFHRARTAQILHLRPNVSTLINHKIYRESQKYIDEVIKIPNFINVLEELKIIINEKSSELNLNNISDYPRIIMLGTGCSVPNKIRNTSSILLRINKDSSILLDCGEGTLGQIIRYYGVLEGLNILRTIKAIYISHIHADHHLGLIGLLLQRRKITSQKLYLLSPKNIMPWLNFYNDRFESIVHQYILIDNNNIYLNYHKLPTTFELELYNKLDIKEINTIHVPHCKQSFGIAITLKNNKKIVYSGDTIFCRNLITLGQNCDLLIHEATMEDGLEKLAKNKEINVGLAYDFMEFKLPQLPLLPLFYPCIKVMFNEYNKVMNN